LARRFRKGASLRIDDAQAKTRCPLDTRHSVDRPNGDPLEPTKTDHTACRVQVVITTHRYGCQARKFKVCLQFVRALLCLSLAVTSAPTAAFVVVPIDKPGEYLKWGPSNIAGTPGGVVTWGLLVAGTLGSSVCGSYCEGNSVDALPHFYATPERDNKTTLITLLSLQPAIQAAFEAWSAVADVQFEYVGVDDSLKPINDPTATSPQIRIGVY